MILLNCSDTDLQIGTYGIVHTVLTLLKYVCTIAGYYIDIDCHFRLKLQIGTLGQLIKMSTIFVTIKEWTQMSWTKIAGFGNAF